MIMNKKKEWIKQTLIDLIEEIKEIKKNLEEFLKEFGQEKIDYEHRNLDITILDHLDYESLSEIFKSLNNSYKKISDNIDESNNLNENGTKRIYIEEIEDIKSIKAEIKDIKDDLIELDLRDSKNLGCYQKLENFFKEFLENIGSEYENFDTEILDKLDNNSIYKIHKNYKNLDEKIQKCIDQEYKKKEQEYIQCIYQESDIKHAYTRETLENKIHDNMQKYGQTSTQEDLSTLSIEKLEGLSSRYIKEFPSSIEEWKNSLDKLKIEYRDNRTKLPLSRTQHRNVVHNQYKRKDMDSNMDSSKDLIPLNLCIRDNIFNNKKQKIMQKSRTIIPDMLEKSKNNGSINKDDIARSFSTLIYLKSINIESLSNDELEHLSSDYINTYKRI